MRKLFRFLRKKRFQYQPLAQVLIYRNNLLHNLKIFQEFDQKLQIAPVLKSNAYSHGLTQVAAILDKQNITFMVIDSYYEAMILKNEGIKSKILVIGFTPEINILRNNLKNVSFTVANIEILKELSSRLNSHTAIHLKIDTGMNRQGISPEQLPEAINLIRKNPNILLEGVCSHLADANNKQSKHTLDQISNWNKAVEILEDHFPRIKYRHLAATDGITYSKSNKIKANVLRVGIGLYGLSNAIPELKPVLELKSVISSVKQVAEGRLVGYSPTFKTPSPMKIALVPMGYYEGVDRRLSNKGSLKCQGVACDIIGLVSMNMTAINVNTLTDVKIGDEVVIISANKNDANSLENIAKICNTIPYEILVHISKQIERVVV